MFLTDELNSYKSSVMITVSTTISKAFLKQIIFLVKLSNYRSVELIAIQKCSANPFMAFKIYTRSIYLLKSSIINFKTV